MTEASVTSETGTRDRILDIAQRLIQLRGYSAISYADIARELGIRKASIHYYFPTKANLGVAVIERYAALFDNGLENVEKNQTLSNKKKVKAYFTPYLELADDPELVCLNGALSGELAALPEEMQIRLGQFFTGHQIRLMQFLAAGVEEGEFQLPVPPAKYARMIVNLLQGALLVKRATGDTKQLYDAIEILQVQLDAKGTRS